MSDDNNRLIASLFEAVDKAGEAADGEHDRVVNAGLELLKPIIGYFDDLGRAGVPRQLEVTNDYARSDADLNMNYTVKGWGAPDFSVSFRVHNGEAIQVKGPKGLIDEAHRRRLLFNSQTFGGDVVRNLVVKDQMDEFLAQLNSLLKEHLIKHRPYGG